MRLCTHLARQPLKLIRCFTFRQNFLACSRSWATSSLLIVIVLGLGSSLTQLIVKYYFFDYAFDDRSLLDDKSLVNDRTLLNGKILFSRRGVSGILHKEIARTLQLLQLFPLFLSCSLWYFAQGSLPYSVRFQLLQFFLLFLVACFRDERFQLYFQSRSAIQSAMAKTRLFAQN